MGANNIHSDNIDFYLEEESSFESTDNSSTISEDNFLEQETFQIIKKNNKNLLDSDLIEKCISEHFFIYNLEKKARYQIIKEMSLIYIPSNTIIFRQGTIGKYFYILKSGEIEYYVDNTKIDVINKPGESFGVLSLLNNCPRTITTKTLKDSYIWRLDKKTFNKIIEHINKIKFEENKTFIQNIPIFYNLTHYQQTQLCSSILKMHFVKNEKIFNEGEVSNCFFIIKEGEIDYMKNNKLIKTLKEKDYFGVRSILLNSNRSKSTIAKTDCVCYSITKKLLKDIFGHKYILKLYTNLIKSIFYNSKIFNRMNEKFIEFIFDLFEIINLNKNNVLFGKGYKKNSNFIVVLEGNLINGNNKQILCERGNILFENEIYNEIEEEIDYDILSEPDCLILKANTKKILEKLGYNNFEIIFDKSKMIKILSKIFIFQNLSFTNLLKLTESLTEECFKKGLSIIKEGENGKNFYILFKGKVEVTIKGKYIRTLNENDFFGERAFLLDKQISATITALENVELYCLSQKDFFENINNNKNMKKYLINRLYLYDDTITLNDLLFSDELGCGNFGNVYLVKNKKNNVKYAIKCISYQQILNENLEQNLLLERSILLTIDNPFIVKLIKTLKDDKYAYFLQEFIDGEELFDILHKLGRLNVKQTQFYIGSLLLAIQYLHNKKVIYRDIKPENIIIKYENGYLKLIDFGTAKIINDCKTKSIIGTPNYMAPEVILGKEYSFYSDVWSIGVCLYEFICGCLPFVDNEELNPINIYNSIVNNKLYFPEFVKDKEVKNLINQMLNKNLKERLFKIKQIKNHLWFKDFNWNKLRDLSMDAPFIPKKIEKNKHKLDGMEFVEYIEKYSKKYDEKNKNQILNNNEKDVEWYKNF